jgi:hypothetical protein
VTERVVDLEVAAELEASFDTYLCLIPGREVERRQSEDGTYTIVRMAILDAPAGAVEMSPWFTFTEGQVGLGGIEYFDADGHRIS